MITDRFKFRFFMANSKEMVYADFNCIFAGAVPAYGDATLMQCTGLHDKNGKLIYEGDFLHWDYGFGRYGGEEPEVGFAQVTWSAEQSCWLLGDEWICEYSGDYEVIGNIHENPKLVEE